MKPVDAAYTTHLGNIHRYGMVTRPRDMETKEVLNNCIVVPMEDPIVSIPERGMGYRFLAAEPAWILSGSNSLSYIQQYAQMMERFSDDGMTLSGAYGPPVIDQLSYAANAIIADEMTRQSVIVIWRPRPGYSKDIPCTLTLQFLIRNGHMHTIANMRSSDAWLGVPNDIVSFSMITVAVASMVAGQTGEKPKLGNLHLNAGSSHIYDRNYVGVAEILSRYTDPLPSSPNEFNLNSLVGMRVEDLVYDLKAMADNEDGILGLKGYHA